MRNRTADLLLTMETLCLLSYRGALMPLGGGTNRPRYRTFVTSPASETVDMFKP
jgi:hypothetical protein